MTERKLYKSFDLLGKPAKLRSKMMRLFKLLAIWMLIGYGTSAAAADAPQFDIGEMKSISKALPTLIKLTLRDGKLALDRAHWGNEGDLPDPAKQRAAGPALIIGGAGGQTPASHAFSKVQQAAGGGGSNRIMMGGNSRISFSSRNVFGLLQEQGDSVKIFLQDQSETRCELDVEDQANGSFRLLLTNADGQLLTLFQSPKGPLNVVDLTTDTPVVKKFKSFAEFYRNDPAYLDERLMPMLARVGIAPFPGRFSPPVIQTVLARLRPMDDADQQQFDTLLKQLDDDDYDQRQAAIKAMAERYAKFSNAIEQAAKKPASEEVKVNLRKILEMSEKLREIPKIVASLDLTNDAVYLAQLAGKLDGKDRKAVEARIAELITEAD
jgi:hypothetical protein